MGGWLLRLHLSFPRSRRTVDKAPVTSPVRAHWELGCRTAGFEREGLGEEVPKLSSRRASSNVDDGS